MNDFTKPAIIPRENLDFGLDGDIPKYWLNNDPAKTRFFDALSVSFPEGERYFIESVRAFKDKIVDPKLIEEVKAFTRQEAQHGIAHTQYNNRLQAQGIRVDVIEKDIRTLLKHRSKILSRDMNLAFTAAAEHVTAIMCHGMVEKRELMDQFDPRMRALYAWHAMEEVEHKAVAFDVMANYSNIGYFRRVLVMLAFSIPFNFGILSVANYMLRVDRFGFWQRAGMLTKLVWWLYKPTGGIISSLTGHYLKWFKPNFHPWGSGEVAMYKLWMDCLKSENNDPVKATNTAVDKILNA